MGTPTQTYVDPGAGNDTTGDGSVSTPWATVQHALDTITRDATNGDQINIKAGTDDVLSSALDFGTYGTPATGAPIILRGYTSAANDGGIGGISGGGSVGIVGGNSMDRLWLLDLHLHNTGAAPVLAVDDWFRCYNCEIDTTTSDGIRADWYPLIVNCHVHDIGDDGIQCDGSSRIAFNVVEDCGDRGISVIDHNTIIGNIVRNCVDGIWASLGNLILNNTVAADASSGQGIQIDSCDNVVIGNIITGVSGVGGCGLDTTGNDPQLIFGHQAYYNNATNESLNDLLVDLGNSDALAASPFLDAAGDNYAIGPAANVKAGGWPSTFKALSTPNYLDKGAAQRLESMRRPRGRLVGG